MTKDKPKGLIKLNFYPEASGAKLGLVFGNYIPAFRSNLPEEKSGRISTSIRARGIGVVFL